MLNILLYIKEHIFSLSFFCALVFCLMDAGESVDSIGYGLYYPMLFITATYAIFKAKHINFLYVTFLVVCFISITFNKIPSYFHIHQRYAVYIILFLAFSGLINGRRLALFRLHLLHIFTYLTIILVIINYIAFIRGDLGEEQLEIYLDTGLYTGSTSNNEMALLASTAIMALSVILIRYFTKINILVKILIFIGLYFSISMMALASSRTGLICTIIAVIVVVYKINQKNLLKLSGWTLVFILAVILTANFMGDKFKYMIQKNNDQLEFLYTGSRDEMWKSRIIEFKESPIFGIGFGYMKYGWGKEDAKEKKGRIETGSGWLTVLSQTGILGAICVFLIVLPNFLFVFRRKVTSYCNAWLTGFTILFLIQPISESYITTVGAVLGCLFWLNHSVIEAFRKGILKDSDLISFNTKPDK